MKILHIVRDEKFIDGAISLFDTEKRFNNVWICLSHDIKYCFRYIRSERVKVVLENELLNVVQLFDVVFLHSLGVISREDVLKIPNKIKVVWLAWGYDIYEGKYPLIRLPLYLPKTKVIYKQLFESNSLWKRLKRQIKECVYKSPSRVVLDRIDFFGGVLPYEYDLLKNKYSNLKAKRIDFSYGSTDFFIKDDCPKEISNRFENIIIGNSANISNNHADILSFVFENYRITDSTKIIIPLSYGGQKEYVDIIRGISNTFFGDRLVILDSFIPINEYMKLCSNCKTAFFGHVRQQAMWNIWMQLMSGARVFMTESSLAYWHFKNLGMNIYSIENDMNLMNVPLSYSEIMHNRRILVKYYSVSEMKKKVSNMYELFTYD